MKTSKVMKVVFLIVLIVLLGTTAVIAQGGGGAEDVVTMKVGSSAITWTPVVGGIQGMTLTVTGPNGYYLRQEFGGRASLSSRGLVDGLYLYEVVLSPAFSGDMSSDPTQRGLNFFQPYPMKQSGGFTVSGGSFVYGGVEGGTADQLVPDDMIVQGSLCVGLDCVNNETFGFDTIRLKENNTRLQFDDTSSQAGFPTNNWQLRANSSVSGESSFFGIVDQGATGSSETGTIVFSVTAGAPSNSVFVSNTGNVGFGTGTPVLDLHIATSDTPAVRLEQNSSGGWTPQTWDIAGNEANFFVRDVTGGSRLPFRIRPGAPTSSIDISAAGNVGIGTASPAYNLDVLRAAGVNATLAVRQDTGATTKIVSISNQGRIGTETNHPLHFIVNNVSKMNLSASGNLIVTGSVTATAFNPSSDKYLKENFATVNQESVLERLAGIPISTWNFKEGDGKVTHMGPMAQDFYAAFGLGMDDKHISTVDADGVAFAAIQELNTRNESLQSENAALRNQVEELAGRVSALEGNGPLPTNQSGLLIVFLVCMNLAVLAWSVYSQRGRAMEIKHRR